MGLVAQAPSSEAMIAKAKHSHARMLGVQRGSGAKFLRVDDAVRAESSARAFTRSSLPARWDVMASIIRLAGNSAISTRAAVRSTPSSSIPRSPGRMNATECGQGNPIKHPGGYTVQLQRPLDFQAVTD